MTETKEKPRTLGVYKQYWCLYGGWRALFESGYFVCAVSLTVLSYWYWSEDAWWDTAIAILPNVLGFSIAAFTMLLAFGNDRFIVVLSQRPSSGGISALETTVAAFFHFLLIQVGAILVALLRKASPPLGIKIIHMSLKMHVNHSVVKPVIHYVGHGISGIGFFLLCYSMFCALAASARLFSLAIRFREVVEREEQKRLEREERDLDEEFERRNILPKEPRS